MYSFIALICSLGSADCQFCSVFVQTATGCLECSAAGRAVRARGLLPARPSSAAVAPPPGRSPRHGRHQPLARGNSPTDEVAVARLVDRRHQPDYIIRGGVRPYLDRVTLRSHRFE